MHVFTRAVVPTVIALAVAFPLTACGGTSTPNVTSSDAGATTSIGGVTVTDAWVKAADTGMTAMFGTVHNTGAAEVTVVSGSTDVASTVELHEVVMDGGTMKMQPKEGGFVVPAGGTHVLEPGGDHVMIMGLSTPVQPGDPVTVVLAMDDGTEVTVDAVGKEFTGANETYAPTMGGMTP